MVVPFRESEEINLFENLAEKTDINQI